MSTAQVQTEREAFIARRRTGIGGSDVAAILGISPYTTPLQVWAVKTGRLADTGDNAILRRGRKLEPVIASEYEEETGRKTIVVPEQLRSKDYPWMVVHLDRLIEDDGRPDRGVFEGKSANAFRVRDWEEEAPIAAQVQLQHGMIVAGLTWGSVAGLLGGVNFKWQDFDLHDGMAAQIVERTRAFWELVESDTPPEPEVGDAKVLGQLFAEVTQDAIALPDEAFEWDRQRLEAAAEIKRLEKLKEEAENKLRFAIGHHELGLFPGNRGGYSLRLQQRKAYTAKACSFRVLRRTS